MKYEGSLNTVTGKPHGYGVLTVEAGEDADWLDEGWRYEGIFVHGRFRFGTARGTRNGEPVIEVGSFGYAYRKVGQRHVYLSDGAVLTTNDGNIRRVFQDGGIGFTICAKEAEPAEAWANNYLGAILTAQRNGDDLTDYHDDSGTASMSKWSSYE